MALPSALLSLSLLPLLPSLPPVLGKQLTGTAPTHWTSQQSPVRPGPTDRCGPHEYWSAGHCCLLCPAGEYVREPCSRPHTRGQCEKCGRGTFTAFPNGLESCLLCATCPEDQDEVAECTSTSNRACRCRPGRFYRAPGNEEFCRRCSTCPDGTVVLQQCNSTADTVCGPPVPESRHRLCLVGSFLCPPFALIIIYLCIKKPKDGGLQSMCSGLPNCAHAESEPLEETSLVGSLVWGGSHRLPSHPVTEKTLQAASGDRTLLSVSTGPQDQGESLWGNRGTQQASRGLDQVQRSRQ
ncbi:tumor necrosis factor receptor superfamily member 22-like [Glossophaga mutica]